VTYQGLTDSTIILRRKLGKKKKKKKKTTKTKKKKKKKKKRKTFFGFRKSNNADLFLWWGSQRWREKGKRTTYCPKKNFFWEHSEQYSKIAPNYGCFRPPSRLAPLAALRVAANAAVAARLVVNSRAFHKFLVVFPRILGLSPLRRLRAILSVCQQKSCLLAFSNPKATIINTKRLLRGQILCALGFVRTRDRKTPKSIKV
jgi:hypothetical protein